MQLLKQNITYIAWMQALVATAGSLYFSEVMKLVPCVLCWYQRILMYPLVILLAIAIIRKDQKIYLYALPMSLIGWGIALFHYLLQMEIIPDAVAPCVAGISCTDRYIEWLGFITIPFLSLVAFSAISVAMIVLWRADRMTSSAT